MANQKLVKCTDCLSKCKLADDNFSCLAGTPIGELELIANVVGYDYEAN